MLYLCSLLTCTVCSTNVIQSITHPSCSVLFLVYGSAFSRVYSTLPCGAGAAPQKLQVLLFHVGRTLVELWMGSSS